MVSRGISAFATVLLYQNPAQCQGKTKELARELLPLKMGAGIKPDASYEIGKDKSNFQVGLFLIRLML